MKRQLCISAILCIALCSCSLIPERKLKSNLLLEERIKEAISNGESELVISKLTDFNWDSLLILGPYTWIDNCEVNFGIDCTPIEHTNIQHLEDICVLVFLEQGEISQMVVSTRHPGDFTPCADRFYSREESIFEIVVTDRHTVSGETWIELDHKRSTTPNTR